LITRRSILLFCSIVAMSIARIGSASTSIYSQGSQFPNGFNSWGSRINSVNEATVYDDFTLEFDATVSQVSWQGLYYDPVALGNNPVVPPTVSWEIALWSDRAGFPDAKLHSIPLDADDITLTFVAYTRFLNNTTVPVFNFVSPVFPSFDTLMGTKYWLSVQADNVDTTINFGWMSGIGGDDQSVQDFNGLRIRPRDRAFSLHAIPEPPTLALVDIKPSSAPNSVNLKSKGVLPVAILGTAEFDVTEVDFDTLMFGDPLLIDNGGTAVSPLLSAYEDVSGDGLLDLTLKFSTSDLVEHEALGSDTIEGLLTGELLDGTLFEGMDSIRIVPRNKSKGNSLQISTVPEPTTSALALAVLCLAISRRRCF
jgi:hypothetical protein